jgi:hypothetical protein
MKFHIEQVDNGYILTTTGNCLPVHKVFKHEEFVDLVTYIGRFTDQLKFDETFMLIREKE